jgi:meiotically up-regulated gene 157 (Mug157) protein
LNRSGFGKPVGQNDCLAKTIQGAQIMFGFTSEKSKLEKKYKQLLDEAYQLSHTNRKKSDDKTAEAEAVRIKLDTLENSKRN